MIPPRRRMSKAARRAFYDAQRGDSEFPLCNVCLTPILLYQRWVESHMPVPRVLGGTQTGIAHEKCNARRWANVEAPMLAKLRHQYDLAHDLKVTRDPLPGSRGDPRKRKIDGTVVDRTTGEPWRTRK